MAVYKDKKRGSWFVIFRVRDNDGKLKQTTKRGFKRRSDAVQYELLHKHETPDLGSVTFSGMFEEMSRNNNAGDLTTSTRRNRLKKYAPDLFDKELSKISKADLQRLRSDLSRSGLAASTINDTLGYVKQIFNYAAVTYDLPDPARILKPVKDTRAAAVPDQMHIITPGQFSQLVAADPSIVCREFFTFLYLTGCRKGEARALLKKDYQTKDGQKGIMINKSMRRYQDSIKAPKTSGSVRFVPLDDQCIDICEQALKRPGKWLFGDETPLSLTLLQDHFKQDLKDAGLDENIRIHDLRHSHVSLLWANGVPVPEISHRIGHASPAVTMRTYSHIFDNTQTKSLKILNSLKIDITAK